jgi:hypothetical protein
VVILNVNALAVPVNINTHTVKEDVCVVNIVNFVIHNVGISATKSHNTALTDILRYAQDVKTPEGGSPSFVFTNLEYGLRDAYFNCNDGIVQIAFWAAPSPTGTSTSITPKALVNSGSYNGLKVTNFTVKPPVKDSRGIYFEISYKIESPDGKTKDAAAVVRLMAK